MKKCPACKETKSKSIWVGKARVGIRGNYSNSKTTSFICLKCNTISSHQDEIYPESNFSNGKYRQSVDGGNVVSIKRYLNMHFMDTVSYISYLPIDAIENKKILDFGSGAGILLRLLSPIINLGVGIELDKNLLYRQKNVINVSNFDIADKRCKKYDLITCFSVAGQLHSIDKILQKLVNRLKKNGYLIIADINAKDFLLHYGKETYKKKIFFRQSYQNYYSEKGLKILLKQFNLQHIKTKFLQRYDYENNKNYIIKDKIIKMISSEINSKYFQYYYQSYLEKHGMSDYMILTFKKN